MRLPLAFLCVLICCLIGCSKKSPGKSANGGGGSGQSGGFSLAQFKGKNPVLIVSTTPQLSAGLQEFRTEWQKAKADVQKHGLILIELSATSQVPPSGRVSNGQTLSSEEANDLIDAHGSFASFRVTLIGKDGTVKLRTSGSKSLPKVIQALQSP